MRVSLYTCKGPVARADVMHPSNRKKGNMWGGRHGAGLVNRPQTLRSCKALRGMVRSVVSWS